MDVDVVIGHTTTEDGDITPVTITVTIPAGQTSVDFTVDNADDSYAEGDETYNVTLSGVTTGGGFEAVDVDTTPVETVISDNATPGTETDEEVINVTLSGAPTVNEGMVNRIKTGLEGQVQSNMDATLQNSMDYVRDNNLEFLLNGNLEDDLAYFMRLKDSSGIPAELMPLYKEVMNKVGK